MKLGEKRGNSIFYKNSRDGVLENAEVLATGETLFEEEQDTSLQKRADTIIKSKTENTVRIELGVRNNAHSVFLHLKPRVRTFPRC